MDANEYQRMHAVEDRMWWYRGLHANLLDAVARAAAPRRWLDAGCGTGGFLRRIAGRHPAAEVVGLDVDAAAAAFARDRAGRPVTIGSINSLPFANGSFDVVVSADVLSHNLVDPDVAVGEFYRCLQPRGAVVLNLPAYQWMLSSHDHITHQGRRFTAARAIGLLRRAGFADIRASYWNTFLFPLMALRRKLFPPRGGSDVGMMPEPVEWLFRGVMRVESALLRSGVRLPFGGSVLIVGVKP
jgi:SAM-dependent methyltransferase